MPNNKGSQSNKIGTTTTKEIISGQQVLVLKDNVANQKIISLMPDKLSVTYDISNDGLEVFDEAKHQKAFKDVRKLKMNSYKATKELGAKGVKTEIIGLSGNALEEDLNTFKEKGFDEYLTKLLKFDVLKKAFQSKE